MTSPIVATNFYRGQGLGNQLWMYTVCRSLARDAQVPFSIRGRSRFKGRHLFNLDFGLQTWGRVPSIPPSSKPRGFDTHIVERKQWHAGTRQDITPYENLVPYIEGRTLVDGNFESDRHFAHHRGEVMSWFSIADDRRASSDLCLISFRGGEMAGVPAVFLPRSYYVQAMSFMRSINPSMEFEVVTDDPELAAIYIPGVPIVSTRLLSRRTSSRLRLSRVRSYRKIASDFKYLRSARNLILSNSSFSWWAAYTSHHATRVVAPKYWQAFNSDLNYWSPGSIDNSLWIWLDKHGRCTSGAE